MLLAAAATTAAAAAAFFYYRSSSSFKHSFLLLSDDDVAIALPMKDAINVNRLAFLDQHTGEAVVPERIVLSLPQYDGATLFKPCYVSPAKREALGLKIVSTRPRNARLKDHATVPAVIVLIHADTGYPSALVDATYLTALRTAAGSGVATDLLALPDASVLTVFGAGAQVRFLFSFVLLSKIIEVDLLYDDLFFLILTFLIFETHM